MVYLADVPCELENNVHSAVVERVDYSSQLYEAFEDTVEFCCLLYWFSAGVFSGKGVVKSLTITVESSISSVLVSFTHIVYVHAC